MKIGFFGGSFNPPTNAHINLAKKVLRECKLDKVIIMPIGDFYEKKELVSEEHRYKMLQIACNGLKNIEVSNLELNKKEKLYASDTFKIIEENYKDADKFFIMGADNFINIKNWKDADELIEKYKYIIIERKNINLEEHINNDKKLSNAKIHIIKNDEYSNYSSSAFRDIFKQEKAYNQEIISDEVLDYIIENDLF